MKTSGIITLTTDFGLDDPYAAVMKGVVLSINPVAKIIDISHSVKAGSIVHAAVLIREAYLFFPKGTVHVAVIDPGVGGKRRPILIKTENYVFVGPDNGVFWPIIKEQDAAVIIHATESRYFLSDISNTFHGRDIFAPVAAHICKGVNPLEMGEAISDPVVLDLPVPEEKGDALYGQVMRVDHFGNLISNLKKRDLDRFLGSESCIVILGKTLIKGLRKSYSEGGEGETLALIGSSECLEIAVNKGRASDISGADPDGLIGMEIEVKRV